MQPWEFPTWRTLMVNRQYRDFRYLAATVLMSLLLWWVIFWACLRLVH